MSAARVVLDHRDGPTKIPGVREESASRKTKMEMGGRTRERGPGQWKREAQPYICMSEQFVFQMER